MASIKVKFRVSTVDGKEGSIYYQIIHGRTVRQVRTKYRLFSYEWDASASAIKILPSAPESRRSYLQSAAERIKWDKKRMKAVVAVLESKGKPYTADEIVERFKDNAGVLSMFSFMQNVIVQLKRLNRIRTSETYAATLASYMKFREGKDILLCEMDSNSMMFYEAWLKGNGICPNTISFYMRILRAVYNRAVEMELTEQRYPFKHVYTGIDKTVKRAVPLKMIKRIKELDLTLNPHLDYARDMFLFSFYTRGMSFIDMAYLKKSDLKNSILTYRRRKTGQQLTIKWEKCMEKIVVKYEGCSATQYLLPIITRMDVNERTQYQNAISRVNIALKTVARLVNLTMPLTMYCSRHSWASIAKSKNIPLSVISEGMGHDSEETTRIYLASLDTSIVDEANTLIINSI